MRKRKLAGASAIAAMLAAILLPAPAASAVAVDCGDDNFVRVLWHSTNPGDPYHHLACFAGAGKNWFSGDKGWSSWIDHLHTGNNDITFVDCNGSTTDFPRGNDIDWGYFQSPCVAWINIKPY